MTPLGLGQLRLFPFFRAHPSCAKQCPALQRSCACSHLLEAAETLSWRAATSYHYYHTNTDHNCFGFTPKSAHTSPAPIWSGTFMSNIMIKGKLIAKGISDREHWAENWTHLNLNGLSGFVGVWIYKLRAKRGDLLSQGGIKGWIWLLCYFIHIYISKYRIMEAWNDMSWKGPWSPSIPTPCPGKDIFH